MSWLRCLVPSLVLAGFLLVACADEGGQTQPTLDAASSADGASDLDTSGDPDSQIDTSAPGCVTDGDCLSGESCDLALGVCVPAVVSCSDGVQNGDETGVDCGGPCGPCAGDECANDADCQGAHTECVGGGCVCEAGYAFDAAAACVDVDECADEALNGCDALVDCTNTEGDYVCGPCPPDHSDVFGDGTFCLPFVATVYAESRDTLYSLNPDTHDVTVIGTFSGCTGVLDIAVDKDQRLFGTTFDGLYQIDPATASCTLISAGDYPNSLSFVPAGTLDPVEEVLVGYFISDYVTIDTVTGSVATIGSLTNGYTSSGDIVSIVEGGTYLTVSGNGCDDCLVEVDPVTGDITRNWGSVNHSNVFGLAYWGGVAYGFSSSGEMFEILFDTPSGTVTTQNIAFPSAPANLSFWGAGSTTIAPVIN